ncbi:MAG: prolyl oligopeptidase family protein [Planctomycetaceae bacterium]
MPPATRKLPVEDTYHGVTIRDDFRWLENGNDTNVQTWSDAQNAFARAWLDRLPATDALRARVTAIMSAKTIGYSELAYRKNRLFAIKREPPKQQPFLVVMPLVKPDEARVLVDPNQIDPSGSTAIDWYVPSPDGKRVAVSLSRGGTESGDVTIFDVETGKSIFEVVPRVNSGTAGGDLAWGLDGNGFYYTRHPLDGERPPEDLGFFQQIYFHQLGTPTATDRYELGKDFPRVAEIQFEMHSQSGTLLATVQDGDGGEFALYLRSSQGEWNRLSIFKDQIVQATFGKDNTLSLVSNVDAPRGRILRLSLSNPDVSRAEVIVPEGDDTIVTSFHSGAGSVQVTDSRLYILYQRGGPSELRVFDLAGKPLAAPKQLPVSSVGGLTRLDGDDVLFSNTSFVSAPAYYQYSARNGRTEKTGLATASPVDLSNVEVVREFATSKDGTRVPVNILFAKGMKRDGRNPALLTGYGGYGISLSPQFSAVRKVLLEQGFVYAVANIRGGGEFGEEWHRQGNLTNKQNVFDDFAAAMNHLVEEGYTSPDKLAIEGGSNGGLLVGALATQHPDRMRAVVAHVGIFDMLRVELSPNGVFNIPEFGTVKDPDQFRALYAYSPYHRVKDGAKYPAMLFLTGANDPRVDAMQSRKMVARLQDANASSEPILLRTSSNTGHGGDSPLSARIEQTVDVYSFLVDRLGVKLRTTSAE